MKYQYTIEGNVIQGPGIVDSAGYLALLGITVGISVGYTFIIDLSAPGFIVMADGSIKSPTPNSNSFYAKYVSGTTLNPSTFISSHDGMAEQNYGNPNWLVLQPPFGERYIGVAHGNNYLQLSNMEQQPDSNDSWPIGSNFGCSVMMNSIYDASGNVSRFAFEGTIKQVLHLEPTTPPAHLRIQSAQN